MKYLLNATALLLATGGLASADTWYKFEGEVKAGVIYEGVKASSDESETNFEFDPEINFVFGGSTQDGLTYGFEIDLFDIADIATAEAEDEEEFPGELFIEGNFGKFTFGGDANGAFKWALSEADDAVGGEAVGDDFEEHAGYFDSDELDDLSEKLITLRYENSIGDLNYAVSISDINEDEPNVQAGLAYHVPLNQGALELDAGYGQRGDENLYGLSALYEINGFAIVAGYVDGELDGEDFQSQYIGLGYETGRWTFHGNYGEITEGTESKDGFGLAADYELRDNLILATGYGVDDEEEFFSIGLALEF